MDQQEEARWQPTRRQLLWTSAAVALLAIAVLIGYRYGITLWDWIKLLIVPALIAAGGLWFNAQQRERELQIASEHAQDAAVQAYLDQLTQLLVTERDQDLLRMQLGDEVRQVIQARSVPLLRSVTAGRRWSLIQFLSLMGLLGIDQPIVSVAGADLRGVDGRRAQLLRVNLAGANLSGANLSEADLSESRLLRANLSEANLRDTDLSAANLSQADLKGADLREAVLRDADLSGADLRAADLSGANFLRTNLRDAILSLANLSEANLRDTDLSAANLSLANLTRVDLRGVDLSNADLTYATMPNGQKYEEWLKSREGEGG